MINPWIKWYIHVYMYINKYNLYCLSNFHWICFMKSFWVLLTTSDTYKLPYIKIIIAFIFISFENKWYINTFIEIIIAYIFNSTCFMKFFWVFKGSFWVLLTTSDTCTYKNLCWNYNCVYSHYTSFIKSFLQQVINKPLMR